MGKDKNLQINKNGDIVYHTADEFLRMALSFIPYGGGNVIDAFLNFQGNLKRRRVIEFSESLKNSLEKIADRELHANDFNSEDFVDIMESVYKQVQSTKSKYKLEKFKNILINQIISKPEDYQLTLKYIELVAGLSDIEMIILNFINEGRIKSDTIYYTMRDICNKLAENERSEHEINVSGIHISVRMSDVELQLSVYDIEFYVLELIKKGLIFRRELMINRPQLLSTWGEDFIFQSEPVIMHTGNDIAYLLSGFGHYFIHFTQTRV
ncbi:hypothetical protein G5B10_07660 [Fluviicola sp. SGL-29]|nr:hypothetical protein [Fluviicola sp. SGL-29]